MIARVGGRGCAGVSGKDPARDDSMLLVGRGDRHVPDEISSHRVAYRAITPVDRELGSAVIPAKRKELGPGLTEDVFKRARSS